jgi:hypothetical protein
MPTLANPSPGSRLIIGCSVGKLTRNTNSRAAKRFLCESQMVTGITLTESLVLISVKSSSTECDDSPAQQFVYVRGSTSIQLAGTDLCVNFPTQGKNGDRPDVKTCRAEGAPGQKLFITTDDHIALEKGPGQCADVRNGEVKDGLGELQSWRCAKNNSNQASRSVPKLQG